MTNINKAITEIGQPDPPDLVPFTGPKKAWQQSAWRWVCNCGAHYRDRKTFLEHISRCAAHGIIGLTEAQRAECRRDTAKILAVMRQQQYLLDANRPALREALLEIMGNCPSISHHAHDTVNLIDNGGATDRALNDAVNHVIVALKGWRWPNSTGVRDLLKRFERATRG